MLKSSSIQTLFKGLTCYYKWVNFKLVLVCLGAKKKLALAWLRSNCKLNMSIIILNYESNLKLLKSNLLSLPTRV